MSLRAFGLVNEWFLCHDGCKLRDKRQGITEGEAAYEMICTPSESKKDLFPRIGAAHPYSAVAVMESREFIFGPDRIRMEARYAGASEENLDQPVYDLVVGTEEVPIETHPNFVASIGGKPSAPLHGAQFVDASGALTTNDALGTFAGFLTVVGGVVNPFAGVEAYLDASAITWRQRYVSRTPPSDLENVHRIVSPPGPVPNFSGRNWLYVGCSAQQRGARSMQQANIGGNNIIYDITRDFRLSGRRGWNATIYAAG